MGNEIILSVITERGTETILTMTKEGVILDIPGMHLSEDLDWAMDDVSPDNQGELNEHNAAGV